MTQDIHIMEIRELAKMFTPEEMETCIALQLKEGTNVCNVSGPTEHVINELAKAGFVRSLTDEGVPLMDAVRELAKRIRLVQMGFEIEGRK
jgi:hypothetical protein